MAMRAFSQADRFLSELESRKLKPAYVLVGDEAFFRKRCRDAILEHLVAPEARDFGLFEFDLAETSLTEVLDRARTPLADGAVSGVLRARGEDVVWPRLKLQCGKNRGH